MSDKTHGPDNGAAAHREGRGGRPATLVELLRARAAARPYATAYEFLDDAQRDPIALSLAELDRRARHVAVTLQEAGAGGKAALLLYSPGIDYVVAFWGCLYAGVIAIPAYPPQRNQHAARIARIREDANPAFVLTSEELRGMMAGQMAGHPVRVLTPRCDTGERADDWLDWRPGPYSLAFLQYTSGTTDAPRGAILTHANLMHNSELIRQALEITPDDRMLSWLPPYHDMGLIGGIIQPVYSGCSTTLMSPTHFFQQPARWLRAISDHRCTISGGPNSAYDLCVRKVSPEQRDGLDLSRWRVALNGAEPVRARTLNAFANAFGECGFDSRAFYPCYGLAEATLMVTGGKRGSPPAIREFDVDELEKGRVREAARGEGRQLVGCGHARSGQDVRIVNPDTGAECGEDEVGEIWVRGPSVARGYWRNLGESERVFTASIQSTPHFPFLRTGDLGFIAGDELFITGRIKDLIIINGLNHYPQEIEETAAASHAALRPGGGAAFGISFDGDELLVIVYEVRRTALRWANPQEVTAAVRQAIRETYAVTVDDVVLLRPNGLPRTSSGKVQRRLARQQYLTGSLAIMSSRDEMEAAGK